MLPRCLPSGISSIRLAVWEETWFEEFQDGCHGSHLGYWNRTISAILNFYNPKCLPSSLSSNCSGADVIWRFPRWLPWWSSWISERNHLAILKLHAAPMPSTMFLLHPTYCSGADNNWRVSRWPPWQPSWKWFQWRCRKHEKLKDIWMRDWPWSTDQGISRVMWCTKFLDINLYNS